MEKRLVNFLAGMLILIFILSSISAMKTQIKVKTLQFHNVEIAVADGSTSDFLMIQRFKGQADKYGDVNFTIDSQKSTLDLYVYLKRNNEQVLQKKLTGVENNGETIKIDLIPEGYEAIPTPASEELNLNETNNNLNENISELFNKKNTSKQTEEENVKNNTGITSAVIKDIRDIVFSKKIIYIILGVFMLLIILFVTIRAVRSRGDSSNNEIKIRKLSEVKSGTRDIIDDKMKLIEEAEKKIKEAQEEINKIKNEEKIKEIRKRIENEERELKRLGGRR